MAKRFGSGQCIHCRKYVNQLTSDHVFPQSWYPDTTPLDLEKWQAPACGTCNAEHGKIERRLLQRLALGTDPWVPGAVGIGEKALRSFDPHVAKSDKDRKARELARDKVADEFIRIPALPAEGVLPNIGTVHDRGIKGHLVTEVNFAEVECVMRKIVRGITFVTTGEVLTEKYNIEVLSPDDHANLPDFLWNTRCETFERPPGLRVDRHSVDDDRFAAFFRIFLWERYEFCAFVLNTEFEQSSPNRETAFPPNLSPSRTLVSPDSSMI